MSHHDPVSGNPCCSHDEAPNQPQNPIRVLVVGLHAKMHPALRETIACAKRVKIVGEATQIASMWETAVALAPNVVLLDLSMTNMAALQYIDAFCNHPPTASEESWPPALLALSAYFDREFICRLFAIGVKGYLLLDEPPERIAAGIVAVTTTSLVLSKSVQASLQKPHRPSPALSAGAATLLSYVARGYTDVEISRMYQLETVAVQHELQRLLRQLPGVTTRSDAVSWAWEHGVTTLCQPKTP